MSLETNEAIPRGAHRPHHPARRTRNAQKVIGDEEQSRLLRQPIFFNIEHPHNTIPQLLWN